MALTFPVVASFTRPNDTNAYTSGDAISDKTAAPSMMEFANVTKAGLSAKITGICVYKSIAGVTNLDFDLILFRTEPTAFEDNAAYDPSDAEVLTVVGVVEFLAADVISGANNAMWQRTQLDLAFRCTEAGTSLYGVLVARGAYTPTAQEVFTVRLTIEPSVP